MSKKTMNIKDQLIIGANFETVSRYGDAGAEFLKGLRGVDNETGQIFERGLLKISTYKTGLDKLNSMARGTQSNFFTKEEIQLMNKTSMDANDLEKIDIVISKIKKFTDSNKNNSVYSETVRELREINSQLNNVSTTIKAHSGFSGEVQSISKRNAEAIIEKSDTRFSRSEDVGFGKNHQVTDIVEQRGDGTIITSQMKIYGDHRKAVDTFVKNKKYLENTKLEIPPEQLEDAKNYCQEKISFLEKQASKLEEIGENAKAEEIRNNIDTYKEIQEKLSGSKVSRNESIDSFANPRLETAKNIVRVSHRAGIQGAKFGMAIGGGISAFTNVIAVYSGDKTFSKALADTALDTLTSAGVGYATAFTGTTIKTYMQQSGSAMTRGLSKTGLPAAIVSVCLATAKSIKKYALGEIDEAALAEEMAITATGMLSASMFTMVGQIAVPIPVLGGMIGGMIGYVITNTFYQSFCEVIREQKLSAERLQMLEIKCTAAKAIAETYRQSLEELFTQKLAQLDDESQQLFAVLNRDDLSVEDFCNGMNRFAEVLGKKLSISSMAELDKTMLSDNPLTI